MNPVLVEVLRGAQVESAHRGSVAVFDGDGKPVWELGATVRPVFPRSAVKAIQALPFVESGAADAYGFGRLLSACMAEPFLVSGTDRADKALMSAAPGRVFVKTGAEGVYCAALPELGLGIALKCDDGAGRAAEAMIAAVLARLVAPSDQSLAARLGGLANPVLKNWNGIEVAGLRPTAALA